jgi:hypothetical protein
MDPNIWPKKKKTLRRKKGKKVSKTEMQLGTYVAPKRCLDYTTMEIEQ